MGLYNVIGSCYVPGKGHYVNPTSQPIQVDDEVAGPLVEAGALEPYPAGRKVEWLVSEHPRDWSEATPEAIESAKVSGPYASPATNQQQHPHIPVEIDTHPRVGQGGGVSGPKPPRSRRKSDPDDAA